METAQSLVKLNYKYCIVPKCINTTIKTPGKHFFPVPKVKKVRDKWCKVIKRRDSLSEKTLRYCCEDHFNVEQDTENFMRHRFDGSRLILKKHVLPHIFACQSNEVNKEERPAFAQRRRAEYYENLHSTNVPASVAQQPTEFIECVPCDEEMKDTENPISVPTDCIEILENNTSKNKSFQVNVKDKNKTKSIQTEFRQRSEKQKKCKSFDMSDSIITDASDTDSLSVSESLTSASLSAQASTEKFIDNTLSKIKLNSQLYLGLSQDTYFMIETLVNNVRRPTIDILITFKKIRLNDQYSRLAIDFDLQKSSIAKAVRKTLSPLAQVMRELIYFPKDSDVEENLPMAFRSRFFKTRSIIDCFEIRIQKPSNAMHHSLTWSNYIGCNTLKYLVSITPNGFINFISGGYGGRVDDTTLFEDCKIIDKIPTGSIVLADRGFKHIAPIVESKGCKLVRPPSVQSGVVCDKKEVLETKRIAAVRMERSIQRLRDYKMLAPHAFINVKMLPFFDYIVQIACGLVNLQSLMIKQ